ncbi:phage protein [Vibrio phage pTD1]|uniref:Phage protein n=1 Tax=Vibrio phage pTD1 TaxID=1938577 RepID=A0A1Q2U370_9CAUD|nr:RNA polymerase beta subunit [Vibrio phage pTD1]BAW98402.1 phage protein [Vibrio phage pTD1]
MKPTNVSLLNPSKVAWSLMRPVSSADVNEGSSTSLHPDGLYSVETFGRVGSDERDRKFSYIDVKLPVFNPTYFKAMITLKSLYAGIIKGTEYAVWDSESKDFIKSNLLDGDTGFSFFMKHFNELEPKLTESFRRKKKIELFHRFQPQALTSKILVIPAGLRDVQFSPNDNRTIEPEINEYYRKLLFRTKAVVVNEGEENSPVYDNLRWGAQSNFNDIDTYIQGLMRGKTGFWQKRVATRGVVGGTRNVISARHVSIADADADTGVDVNTTDIGLYQALLEYQYTCRHGMLNGWLQNVFTIGSPMAKLVNPKTFEYEYKEVEIKVVDKWMTPEGLTRLFNGFKDTHLRNKPIMISGSLMGLVYDDGTHVRIVGDKSEIGDRDPKHLRPLTYMELFYISCGNLIETRMSQITRYPITGVGSIYPSKINLRTTIETRPRVLLDDYWEETNRLNNYPILTGKPSYFDAMSVDGSRLQLLGGDFDGDQLNSNGIEAEDSIKQALKRMGERSFYITGSGDFLYEPVVEPHEFLLRALTSGLE